MYRLSNVVIVVLFFLMFSPLVTNAQMFVRNLSLGDTGQDVLELQMFLNTNTQTQVASTGPGSAGNETTYFGPLTHASVLRFQNLYAENILVPLGLTKGTGFFGPSTRSYIASLSQSEDGELKPTTEDINSSEPELIDTGKELRDLALENFDAYSQLFLDKLEEDFSDSEIEQILDNIKKGVKTADYEGLIKNQQTSASVENILEKMREAGASPGPETEDILRQIMDDPEPISGLFINLLLPKKAYAQSLLTPYSSLLNIPYPCTCTGGLVWQMYITGYIYGVPTELSLDYFLGTQWYSFYTLPWAQRQLGFFIPGGVSCWQIAFPCVVIPSFGTVMPIVGSSLII